MYVACFEFTRLQKICFFWKKGLGEGRRRVCRKFCDDDLVETIGFCLPVRATLPKDENGKDQKSKH